MTKKGYNGYLITNKEELLRIIPPKFSKVIAHHITHKFGIDEQLPPNVNKIEIIGEAYNDKIQALIVMINDSSVRPDGGFYHITWSLDPNSGAKPVDSNKLIENNNWHNIGTIPTPVKFERKFFSF